MLNDREIQSVKTKKVILGPLGTKLNSPMTSGEIKDCVQRKR